MGKRISTKSDKRGMINDSTFVGASLAVLQTDFSKSGFTMDAAGVAEEKKGGLCYQGCSEVSAIPAGSGRGWC
ncbi:MAG: hypothetical protein CL546_13850 [Alcanivorax sp.]|nr:hypothetical protein [Alcanivorax sp.]